MTRTRKSTNQTEAAVSRSRWSVVARIGGLIMLSLWAAPPPTAQAYYLPACRAEHYGEHAVRAWHSYNTLDPLNPVPKWCLKSSDQSIETGYGGTMTCVRSFGSRYGYSVPCNEMVP